MQSAKSASTPLPINLRLSQRDCPTSGPEGEDMKSVPYAPAVGSLMYTTLQEAYDYERPKGRVVMNSTEIEKELVLNEGLVL